MSASPRLIFDAAPLIRLARLGALSCLAQAGWAIVPEVVVDEVLADPRRHEDAEAIREAMEAGWVRLRVPNAERAEADRLVQGGEADCLRLFREGRGGEIITDDQPFGRHCLREQIPFRNTPMVLTDWILAGVLDRKAGRRLLAELRDMAHYPDGLWVRIDARIQA